MDAGKAWLDNTNPVFGALNTYRQRIQMDASGQQFYGDDEADALLGTIGETGAGAALDKALKKTECTTLKKIGDVAGNAMYELGQSKVAKSGQIGMAVQGISRRSPRLASCPTGQGASRRLTASAPSAKLAPTRRPWRATRTQETPFGSRTRHP